MNAFTFTPLALKRNARVRAASGLHPKATAASLAQAEAFQISKNRRSRASFSLSIRNTLLYFRILRAHRFFGLVQKTPSAFGCPFAPFDSASPQLRRVPRHASGNVSLPVTFHGGPRRQRLPKESAKQGAPMTYRAGSSISRIQKAQEASRRSSCSTSECFFVFRFRPHFLIF